LEILVMDWLTKAFDLPAERFSWKGTGGGVIQPSATEAAIVAILAAKTRVSRRLKESQGKDPHDVYNKMVCYVSDQAHFCIEKAARVLAIPHFRKIKSEKDPKNGNFPLNVAAVRDAVKKDVEDGLIPFFLSGNFGTTGSTATDDLTALAKIAEEYNLWYNVDAAYAGVTALIPEFRAKMVGIEKCDSILINGSKWLSTMFNTAFLFLSDKRDVVSSLNASGVFLSNPLTDAGLVVDFKDYHLGLGRPFRGLKVYTTIASFGLEGLRDVLKRHMLLAKYFAKKLEEKQGDEESLITVPVVPEFGLVVFRLRNGTDEENTKLLDLLNATNKAYLVHTVSDGKVTLRLSLASPILTYEDMDGLAKLVLGKAKEVKSKAQ